MPASLAQPPVTPLKVAFYEDHKDNQPACVEVGWEDIVEMLSTVDETPCSPCPGKNCPAKYGKAWSPVDIEGTRASDHVKAVTVAVFDLDHVTEPILEEVLTQLAGYSFVIHSTHSHKPPADGCYRVVMPLSRPVPAAEWRATLKALVGLLDIPADPTCKDPSRLYFLPTRPAGSPSYVLVESGIPLDVDALPIAHATPAPPVDTTPQAVDMGALRACLASARTSRARAKDAVSVEAYTFLARVLDGTALAVSGSHVGDSNLPHGRDTTFNKVASLVAFTLPEGTPREAALELLRPSVAATDTEPEGVGHWLEIIASQYDRACARRAERDKIKAAADTSMVAKLRGIVTRRGTNESADNGRKPPPGEGDPGDLGEDAWQRELLFCADGKSLKAGGFNLFLILDNAADTKGHIRWNDFSKKIEINGGRFANLSPEVLDIEVGNWLQKEWGLNAPTKQIGDQILAVAFRSSFDPLMDYLRGLTWDGTSRAESFLMTYCGVSDTPHHRRIGRMWLVSAVARALEPGCKVDTVLILEGKQGIKKSSMFESLAGEWFCDTEVQLGDKDSKMLTASNWIIELSELESLRKSETTAQKAFLSRRTDKFRLPFGRAIMPCRRHCVFIGTTNQEGDYLTDRTGNRRYWPAWCDWINFRGIEADRDQLWAEAVSIFLAAEDCDACKATGEPHGCDVHRWWLTVAEQAEADVETEARMAQSPIEAEIRQWWDSTPSTRRPKETTTHEVAKTVLQFSLEKITRAVEMDIGYSLRAIGFVKGVKWRGGKAVNLYTATDDMLQAPTKPQRHLLSISTAKVKP